MEADVNPGSQRTPSRPPPRHLTTHQHSAKPRASQAANPHRALRFRSAWDGAALPTARACHGQNPPHQAHHARL
eukprot:359060-Chlamydomonas_euryale.AAC.10